MQHSRNYKTVYYLLIVLLFSLTSNNSNAQYIIEGAKYRSIRDSLLNNKKWQRQKDPINSISITGELTSTGHYISPDQEIWQKETPLIDNYLGRKIKHILVQHGTGKAILLLKGKDSIYITEDAAVKEGLLPNEAYSAGKIIKVDTPLYIGSNIPVYIKLQDPENKLVSLQAGIKSTGIPFKYELQSYLPGDVWVLEIGTDGKTKKVYAYTLLPDPEQGNSGPDFFAGEIRSVIVDYNLFKKQDKVTVTDGYSFSTGTIYFTRHTSANVQMATISSPSLHPAQPFLDMCLPGSNVMFDNVTLLDSAGEKIMPIGKSYILIDREDIRSNYSGLISGARFEGGIMTLYRYIIETMIRLPDIDLKKGKFDFDFSFMIEADGTLTDIIKNDFSAKDEIFKACHDLIIYSNGWIPASYKERNMRMPISMRFSIEIK